MKYVYIDINDSIEAVTSIQLAPRSGFSELEISDEVMNISGNEYIEYENGQIVKKSTPDDEANLLIEQKRALIGYTIDRKYNYPDIGDQLDDLFKAGAFSDEMSGIIQAVKDAHPKPGE